ncbi:MAG TPA: RNA-binding protein [Polyangiaceae bacterium]|nr:RNA-binding protein [Polyangiaceae bacterium]
MNNENKLFIGNLDFATGDQELRTAFATYGELVEATVVLDRMTGRPRGFGFVEYRSPEDARKAIDAMNGTALNGRTLNVNVARSREGNASRPSSSSRERY